MTQVLIDREVLEALYRAATKPGDIVKAVVDATPHIRAALEAKPVEPVAWVRYSVGAMPHFVPVIAGNVTFNCSAIEALEYEPLYAAPPEHAPQEPIDKSKLKRLVTQVFGEGYRIVPPISQDSKELERAKQRIAELEQYVGDNMFRSDYKSADHMRKRIAVLERDVAHWRFEADEAGIERVRYYQQIAELESQLAAEREARQKAEKDAHRYQICRFAWVRFDGEILIGEALDEKVDAYFEKDAAIAHGKGPT